MFRYFVLTSSDGHLPEVIDRSKCPICNETCVTKRGAAAGGVVAAACSGSGGERLCPARGLQIN